MLTITSNIAEVTGRIVAKYEAITERTGVIRDKLLRTVCTTLAAEIRYRVHVLGKKSDGSQLPQYSNQYLEFRQRKPFNRTSDKQMIFSLTRQMENDFGLVPEGSRSKKATEEPIKTPNGYTLGFKNSFNAEKAEWLQYGTKPATVKGHKRKSKIKGSESSNVKSHQRKGHAGFGVVYNLTDQEKMLVTEIAQEFVDNYNKEK